jgi:RND family efflux transporter MFP subunit
MKRRYKLIPAIIGSLAVLVLMFMWLTGNLSCEGKIPPGRSVVKDIPATGQRTFEVSAVQVPTEIEAVGTVVARETTEISSRIMAAITEVYADAGENVDKGQSLFVLDSRDARARLTQAREGLASAEATLEQASLDATRIERLHEKQAATKQEHDRYQASLKMARASVEAAKAMVREAKVTLSYARINSPISGRVVDRLADPGDMAAPGKPLMTIYDPSDLRLEVSVGEHLRPKVHLEQQVMVSIESLKAESAGRIVEIVPASDAASRSFIARVSIPDTEAVYPGMYGRIRLPIGSRDAVLIPPDAVQHVGQLEMVTVVEDGSARTRAVKIGRTYPDGLEVLSGLRPGELVAFP